MAAMELDQKQNHDAEDDPFLRFMDYAISVLSPTGDEDVVDEESSQPAWSWVAGRIIKTCKAYSSGVTPAILLSELSQAWAENLRGGYSKKKRPECIDQLQKKHKRGKLPNTVTIDSIYEKNFLSLTNVLEAVIVDAFLLPGTNFYMLTLGDFWSSNTIDLYLHRRFYDLADLKNGILRKGREIFITGCYLRTTSRESGRLRLLPTEYLLIILDEDEDDDAMLLGAQFCSDSLSSISVDAGVPYSLYARIESIGSLEIQGKFGSLQKKQITLVDNDNVRVKFILWGDQIVLANLFSVGSWLALDQPYVSSCIESESMDSCEEICLEYGSVTQLYMVPFIRHEEQVSVASTQNHHQGSKLLTAVDPSQSQGPKFSQVTLPRDSLGAIDFSNYPFRLFAADLKDKMSSISIYGVVTDIKNTNNQQSTFLLTIQDPTGEIHTKLHFVKSWSLGKLSIGHTVYIAGLTCSITKHKSIEVSWHEKEGGSLFVNLSCLPALLNSSCLHKSSTLSDLSSKNSNTHVCGIWIENIEHCDVNLRYCHSPCGHTTGTQTHGRGSHCNFCGCQCGDDDVILSFHLKVTIADDSRKVIAWCTGHTATEILQISPDEFYNLPEEEQIMYPCSLEHERFIVALVNSGSVEDDDNWEITQAIKSD